MKKRILVLIMALAMMMSVAACGGGGDNGSSGGDGGGTSVDADPGDITIDGGGDDEDGEGGKVMEFRNLGGVEITIGDWWTATGAPKMPPKNLLEEQREDLLYYLEEEHGFTIERIGVSGWGDYLETFTTSVMAGDPAADIFIMSAGWTYQMMAQGLLYPLNTLDSLDLSDPKWNSAIISAYTDEEGNVYALTNEKFVEPRNFLFYNKRMFADAGIDPDEPYELQAKGEWTWDKLWEYCEKLTRDLDGDGVTDQWGITGFAVEMIQGFSYANNAREIKIAADGSFYNAMSEPNYVEALQFWQDLHDAGYWINDPDATPEQFEWDWFHRGFYEGHAAMCVPIGAYMSQTFLDQMDDEWGMVFVPLGPKGNDYCSYFGENVYVLPFNISKEKAEDIMYAFNQYTQPVPYEIENPEYWKDGAYGYQRFADSRAVDETLTMFYEGRMDLFSRDFIPGGEAGVDWGPLFDWDFVANVDSLSVIERIQAVEPVVNSVIDRVNNSR